MDTKTYLDTQRVACLKQLEEAIVIQHRATGAITLIDHMLMELSKVTVETPDEAEPQKKIRSVK